MPEHHNPFPPPPTLWRVTVWFNDGQEPKAAQLASGLVDDLDQARTYAEQTAGGVLAETPDAYVWVEALPGHQVHRRAQWSPNGDPSRVAVFDETHRLGTWVSVKTPPSGQHDAATAPTPLPLDHREDPHG